LKRYKLEVVKAKKNPDVQEVAGQRKSHDMMTIRMILVDYTKG
jgi:hypothetical protein